MSSFNQVEKQNLLSRINELESEVRKLVSLEKITPHWVPTDVRPFIESDSHFRDILENSTHISWRKLRFKMQRVNMYYMTARLNDGNFVHKEFITSKKMRSDDKIFYNS